ncbi:MMPL family transporter [Fulvivirgaceae bacterium PWU5]|uniref:MMPL family transporter n=1 Tax=Dawidia cretensis TaxID=2782350 RepID=A0AAP2E3N0_9BACT|nr:trifunctional MMPL family transporter/lysophospholipid acyltransferase/class I SAM-dependent methyltransferase [Dawidia cretensis]MBT1711122.1 MMPL family transporter [Dawidia cretensis]
MEQLFLSLYRFFKLRRTAFWLVFAGTIALLGAGALRLELEEDITQFLPNDPRVEKINYIFQHSKFVERIVVMVSVRDSATQAQPDSLVVFADTLAGRIETKLTPFVKHVSARVDDSRILDLFHAIPQGLPVFLEEADYRHLDSISQPDVARRVLQNNYRQLISPSGIVTKQVIQQDPLGFSFLVLKKLQRLQYDENYELYDNFIMTRDHRHILFFLQPVYPPSETRHNAEFLAQLQEMMDETAQEHPGLMASCFGAPVVAVGNARQLRADTMLTVGLMLGLLIIVLLGFFRKKRVPFLMMIPVAFGALFSLSCIALLHGTLSVLALAVGAVILGIAVNYSLHYMVALKHTHNAEEVIRELAHPLTIGSTTTVLAFFCLQFTNAVVLRDVGLFAGFSLIGAALCSLIFLPHLLREDVLASSRPNAVQRIVAFDFESNRYVVYAILLLTPVFFYFAGQVKFNSDMSGLNFMRPETREAQQRLESLNKASLSSLYVVAEGDNLEAALRRNEQALPPLEALRRTGQVGKVASVSLLMVSDSLQRIRIQRWHSFWNAGRIARVQEAVHAEAAALRFSPVVVQRFDSLLTRAYTPLTAEAWQPFRAAFFDDYIIEKDGKATIITLAQVAPEKKPEVYQALAGTPAHAVDRQMLTNLFVEYIHADFNFIITFTSVLVFVTLLILYGRIELTLITFVPMLVTWIWILGIMALAGIEFNIINVMVSTFIFGLGDDYSIFIMDGLQQEYRTGRKLMPVVRTSIFLSAVTTICGLGVLIFAKHPALRSIAAISIIGIVCVFVMAQTLEPFLFRTLITRRTQRGRTPMTFLGMAKTLFTYGFFVFGAVFLTVTGGLLKLVPFGRKQIRVLYHAMLGFFTGSLVYLAPRFHRKVIGRTPATFSRASMIVCNHSSILDILLTTMLHPKLVLLTNKWVWNSPVFGAVVRLADYYPVMDGAGDSVARLQDRISEGYSVVVFPEGTRSADGTLGRFHKGAFYMAEALRLPVQPLLMHGVGVAIPKGEHYLNDCHVALEFLPPIEIDDPRFGTGYAERTKKISRYFKEEYKRLAAAEETPDYYRYKLILNYLYKGPVLEWYMRIKLRLEKNYAPFEALVPRQATVLDLGCGYGFLCYMLQFMSPGRTITGVDYDEEKIAVAQHGFLRTDRLQFYRADVTQYDLATYDVIIISDVLHYLSAEAQEILLVRCFAALQPGGRLIVRDGNADLAERHRGTRLTEFFSVRLLKFNKAEQALNFVSGKALTALAERYGLRVVVQDETRFTSNVIFVFEKPGVVVATV